MNPTFTFLLLRLQFVVVYLGRIRWGSLKSQILGAHLDFGKVWYIGVVLAKKTEFRIKITKGPLWRPPALVLYFNTDYAQILHRGVF